MAFPTTKRPDLHSLQDLEEIAVATEDRWQSSMKVAFRSTRELAEYLELPQSEPCPLYPERKYDDYGFRILVTREFAARIQKGNPSDPLLLQVWPQASEADSTPGFLSDPVGDDVAEVVPGLLHKYQGRVLMVTTGACAIHCRYCFRRHYPYQSAPKSLEKWAPALEYITRDRSIEEVILSGGDPWMLADSTLQVLINTLEDIPHLQRLRIHTRMPIMIPSRVNDSLVATLRNSRFTKWIVLHINHSQEIDPHVEAAIARLKASGAVILNQAVLLRGINDQVDIQEKLCKKLLANSVIPYYLHQLDRVQGAAHFETELATGRFIIDELVKRLPGFGVPEWVREIADQPSKTRL